VSENPTADEHPSAPGPEAEPPTVPVAAGPEPEPPTVEHTAVAETATTPAAPVPPPGAGTPPESGSSSWWDGPRIVVVGLLVLLLGAGAGFLIGRSTADSGPSSLADAASQTAKGDLPAGDLSLQQLLQDLGQRSGNGNAGGLGGLLGGLLGGKNGDSSALNGLLNQLRDRLGHENGGSGSSGNSSNGNGSNGNGSNGNGSNGNGSNGSGSNGSGGTTSSEAFLGISAAAAPTGQSGVQVAAVAASGPAAEAGLQAGDVITAVDGTAVANPAALVTAIHAHQPGDQVTITYTRGGKSTDVKVRLGNSATATTRPASPTTPPATGTA